MYGAGSDRRKIAVLASGVSIDSTARNVFTPRGCTFFSTSRIENLTSSLVNGLPVVELDTLLQLEGDRLAVRAYRP